MTKYITKPTATLSLQSILTKAKSMSVKQWDRHIKQNETTLAQSLKGVLQSYPDTAI